MMPLSRALNLIALLFLVGQTQTILVRENVVFRKVNEVNPGRSKWTLAIVHDLSSYDRILQGLSARVADALNVSAQIVSRYYTAWEPLGFMRTFVNLDREVIGVNQSRLALHNYFQEYKYLNGSRQKRALLPFIGQVSSFLFGTVSEGDLNSIRRNIVILSSSQKVFSHVAQEALTLLNVTQMEVSANRQSLNAIMETIQNLDSRLTNVTRLLAKTVNRLEQFTQLYLRLDLVVEEMKQTLRTMGFYLQRLHLELNMLSLGRLSPSTVSPSGLISLLQQIKTQLPASLQLPLNPVKDIWNFYKILTCDAVLEENKIIVLINIPLLDASNDFEIFEAHSLPVPMQEKVNDEKVTRDILAEYELEAKAIAVDKERTKYILLNADEVQQCTGSLASHCAMRSPIYPINLSQFCIISLFMRNKEKQQQNCRTIVRPSSILPMAEYMSSGVWIITTQNQLQFSVICHDGRAVMEMTADPPIGVLKLPMTCVASNDHLTLPAFYQFDSVVPISDPLLNLLHSHNISSIDIW